MPAPLGHGGQGDAFGISLGESLQAGDVGGKGKTAVADRQGR